MSALKIKTITDARLAGLRGESISQKITSKKLDYDEVLRVFTAAATYRRESRIARDWYHTSGIDPYNHPHKYDQMQRERHSDYYRLMGGQDGWQKYCADVRDHIPAKIGVREAPITIDTGSDTVYRITVDDCGEWIEYSRRHRYYHADWRNRRIEIWRIDRTRKSAIKTGQLMVDTLSHSAIIVVLKNAELYTAELAEGTTRQKIRERTIDTGCLVVYKCVAVTPEGKHISIFDGTTEYIIGVSVRDEVIKTNEEDKICGNGGIFCHLTPELAECQEYPDQSAALNMPRVILRGIAHGKRNVNGKIATEYFCPVAVHEWETN